eukprot:990711-Pyramimonas_sp.AAC.1
MPLPLLLDSASAAAVAVVAAALFATAALVHGVFLGSLRRRVEVVTFWDHLEVILEPYGSLSEVVHR